MSGDLATAMLSGGLSSMSSKRQNLDLSKVFHQHDGRVVDLNLAVEKRSAVRRDCQTSKGRGGLFQTEDWGCVAGCKVEEFYSPVWRTTTTEKIDSGPGESPTVPGVARGLIQNADFLTAIQWNLPYTRLFKFGVIKEAPVIGFDRIDATVSCYPDRRATFERYLP